MLIYGLTITVSLNINGYTLIPITDKNRAEIYAEFEAKGFFYEASQTAMNEIVDEYLKDNTVIKTNALRDTPIATDALRDTQITTAKILGPLLADALSDTSMTTTKFLGPLLADTPQTWCEYLTGNSFGICDYFA